VSRHPTCYLAGPIAGLSYGAATDWRETAVALLWKAGIQALSPMRAKQYLAGVACFSGSCGPESNMGPLSGSRAVMRRDFFDANRADVLLVNFLGAERVSIGTAMECAWAYARHTPVVVIMEPEGNVHDHAMLNEATGFRASTLVEGVEIVKAILS